MTLFMFIVGILLILGIAKYNKSNKLFWTLFTAYTLGFAGMKLVYDSFSEKAGSEQSLNQAYPTQGLLAMDNAFVCIGDDISYTTTKTKSNPVGQVNTPDYVETCHTTSYVHGVTHGLYLHVLPNPPTSAFPYDTS